MLQPIFDVKEYEGYCFSDDEELMETLLRESARELGKSPSLIGSWVPPSVIGKVTAHNDYPTVYPFPVFSSKAIEALEYLLRANGELLPLEGALPGVKLFHVQSSCRLLDINRSDVVFLDDAQTEVLAIEHFVLDDEKAASFSAAVFRIPELPAEVFVTEEFVERAFAFQLNGFDFVKAWPVEPGVIWRQNSLRTNSDRKRPATPGGTVSNYVINARGPMDEELLSQLHESIVEGASFIRCAESNRPKDIVARIEDWLIENRSTLALSNETDEEERDAIVTMLGALYGNQFCESFAWTWSIVDRSDIEGSTLAIQDPSGDYGVFPLLHLDQLFVHPSSSPKLQLCFDMVRMNSYAQHLTRNTNGSFVDLIESLHAIVPLDDGK